MSVYETPAARDRAAVAPLLEVKNLVVRYNKKGSAAVDDVSFTIARGETLGLVGESGCGKSTTGRAILQLYKPTSGEVNFLGKDLTKLDSGEMRKMRRHLQMIFQDPYASLNPRMTVGNIVSEPMQIHNLVPKAERTKRVQELLQVRGRLTLGLGKTWNSDPAVRSLWSARRRGVGGGGDRLLGRGEHGLEFDRRGAGRERDRKVTGGEEVLEMVVAAAGLDGVGEVVPPLFVMNKAGALRAGG